METLKFSENLMKFKGKFSKNWWKFIEKNEFNVNKRRLKKKSNKLKGDRNYNEKRCLTWGVSGSKWSEFGIGWFCISECAKVSRTLNPLNCMLHDQLDRDFVITTAWNNDVSVHHRWCNIIGIRWLHHGGILLENALKVTTALRNVPEKAGQKFTTNSHQFFSPFESSCQLNVAVSVNENFHIENIENFSAMKR